MPVALGENFPEALLNLKRKAMDLHDLLKSNPAIQQKARFVPPIRTSDKPEEITPGQRRYLMGLTRDYLPDGHSRYYSEADIQIDLLRDFYNEDLAGVRKGLCMFFQLTKREASIIIDWVLFELGRETQYKVPEIKSITEEIPETEGAVFSSDDITW